MNSGVLAGYPVVDVKVELIDGSYHDVDSSERAFKIAGSMAFKEAMKRAKPKLLEPVMAVEVVTPEDFLGDVMGNLNSRRGRIEEMNPMGNATTIKAMRAAVGDVRLRHRRALDDAGARHVHACSSTATRTFPATSPRTSSTPRPQVRQVRRRRRSSNGQAEVRAHEAAPQRRHDRSHRPREDDADSRDHEGARRDGGRHRDGLRRRSTRLPRSGSAGSRSTPRTSSTRRRTGTTRTSTARATPTTSRT